MGGGNSPLGAELEIPSGGPPACPFIAAHTVTAAPVELGVAEEDSGVRLCVSFESGRHVWTKRQFGPYRHF